GIQVILVYDIPFLLAKQGIKLIHEIGINLQKRTVEVAVQLLGILLQHRSRSAQLLKFVQLAGFDLPVYGFPELVQLIQVNGALVDVVTDIPLTDQVGFIKPVINGYQLSIDGIQVAPGPRYNLDLFVQEVEGGY